ncbi:ABC transporter permease [Roseivirga sp.]|uniref:ABC transporter permease n=1 Tax=Roseivirga sp. TaxID=1964215 RepID=UPI002B2677A9|nr:FtsX-like permease family protein [Roseivirga sp.]
MIRNHLKMSFRNLSKRRLYSAINFVSLSIAVMIGLLVFVFVKDELSYDRFHINGDNLFLLYRSDYKTEDPKLESSIFDISPNLDVEKSAVLSMPFLKLIEDRVPEIDKLIRVVYQFAQLKKDGVTHQEDIHYVDGDFFEAFTYPFIEGQPTTALNEISNAVITKEIALKYFGRTNVLGETLTLEGKTPFNFIITGVLGELGNTVLPLGIIVPTENSTYYRNFNENWYFNAINGFVFLKDPSQVEVVNEKVGELYRERYSKMISDNREELRLSESNPMFSFGLKPIGDLYLDSSIKYSQNRSSFLYSIILIGIGAIILLIACINYLSITVASAGSRQLEVGIRKVMGANSGQLRSQFYIEAVLISLFSILGGFTLMQLTLPRFNELAGKSIELSLIDNVQVLSIGLLFALLLAFMAGIYPAQILSRFKAVNGLKGNNTYKIKPVLIKAMVVFQFVLCLFFVSMSLIMHKQFEYMNNKHLGFDKEQIVYIDKVNGKSGLIGEALAKEPSIESYAAASGVFGGGQAFNLGIAIGGSQYTVAGPSVGYNFFETMGIPVLEGNSFNKERSFEEQQDKFILNQSMYELLKKDTVQLNQWVKDMQGVVADFHLESLQNSIGPIMFRMKKEAKLSTLYVRLAPNKTEEGLAAIQLAIDQVAPDSQMNIEFLDSYLNSRYKDSEKWKEIINVASVLGVIIACIGLFGLTGINMANRTKEIGIRKVLGAGFSDVLILLNRQTIWLIVLSTAISLPISYYFMDQWLSGFAYSTSITADIFLLSACICFLVVAITVSFHSVKSTSSNPIDSLRYE